MTTRYELIPTDNRKSFYGKCYVERYENGDETLFSYNTRIMTRTSTGEYHRHYAGKWTTTTGRHIKAFCGMSKYEFLELPVWL